MANQDVKLKHKVQLRKKVEEDTSVHQPEEVNTSHVEEPEVKKSSKSWIWLVIGILVVICVIVGIFVSKSDKSEPTTEVEEVVTEEVVAAPKDSIADEDVSANEAASADETPTEPASEETTPVTPAESQPTAKESTTPSATSVNVSNDVEAEAMKVIRGDYGIGQERKDKLGNQYQTIQNRVNELKREGIF